MPPTESGVEFVDVIGADLPMHMPLKGWADQPAESFPEAVRANCNSRPPSQLESYTVPVALAGRDLTLQGVAPRGAEQVAPLVLPVVARLALEPRPPQPASAADSPSARPRALVLAPSRELASYASSEARALAGGTSVGGALACGGISIESSVESANGVDLLVATPGRLLDLLDRGAASLDCVRFLVLVGIDALFDGGFESHLKRIIIGEGMPPTNERQTLISCASMPPDVFTVVEFIRRPSGVSISAPSPWAAVACTPLVKQLVRYSDERAKQSLLAELIAAGGGLPPPPPTAAAPASDADGAPPDGATSAPPPAAPAPPSGLSVVVVSSRRHCEMLLYFLKGEGIKAGGLASEKPKVRDKEALMSSFTSGHITTLVATDVGLRGLAGELPHINHVISFDFPPSMEVYCERLSLTARGGHTGTVSTIITASAPRASLLELISLLQRAGCDVPRWLEGLSTMSTGE